MSETTTMSGLQKAALVLMQLKRDHAAEILRRLPQTEAEELAAEIVRLRHVPSETVRSVLSEFRTRSLEGSFATRGGRDFAADLLEASFGSEKAAGLLGRLSSALAGRSFEFLDSADATQISTLLDGELPETVAVVLARLRPELASAVLARFDTDVRADVAQAIATMGSPTPEAVGVLAETLRHRARALVVPAEHSEIVGGVQPLVEIINRVDVATEKSLLDELGERDAELTDEIRSRMLTFADLVRFSPRDVQQILRGVEVPVLAVAMKGASPELAELVGANMTERNREALAEEIALQGRIRKVDIDEARSAIVQSIRQLEAMGSITIERVEEEEFVS